MRLTNRDIEFIKRNSIYIFGECEVYIFGSSLKNIKGGDIDIFIISPKNLSIEDKIVKKERLREILEEKFFRPIDVIISKDKKRDIEKEALKGKKIC